MARQPRLKVFYVPPVGEGPAEYKPLRAVVMLGEEVTPAMLAAAPAMYRMLVKLNETLERSGSITETWDSLLVDEIKTTIALANGEPDE